MSVWRWNSRRKRGERSPARDEAVEMTDLAGAIGGLPEDLVVRPSKRPARDAVPPEELMLAARSVV